MNWRKIGIIAAIAGAFGFGATGARDIQEVRAQIPSQVAQIDTNLQNIQRAAWSEAMRAVTSASDGIRLAGNNSISLQAKRALLRNARDACNTYLKHVRQAREAHNPELTIELKTLVHALIQMDTRDYLTEADKADSEIRKLLENLVFVHRGLGEVENFH